MSAPRSSRPESAPPYTPPRPDVPRAAAALPSACWPTEAQADAWLDGELAAGPRAAVAAHLRACPVCRAYVAALHRFRAALRRQRAEQPAAPASLRARVRELAERWHAADAHAADAHAGDAHAADAHAADAGEGAPAPNAPRRPAR